VFIFWITIHYGALWELMVIKLVYLFNNHYSSRGWSKHKTIFIYFRVRKRRENAWWGRLLASPLHIRLNLYVFNVIHVHTYLYTFQPMCGFTQCTCTLFWWIRIMELHTFYINFDQRFLILPPYIFLLFFWQ
jgi:hypothetical protein